MWNHVTQWAREKHIDMSTGWYMSQDACREF